jgi:hypothetical protein
MSAKFILQEEMYIVRSPWSEVVIPETNLADFVWQDVSGHADLPALVSCSYSCTSFVVMVAVNDRKTKFGVLIF